MRVVISLIAVLIAAPSFGQSLTDVARQEEARRATNANKAVKAYSNNDLKPGEVNLSAPGGSSECYMSILENRCVSAEQLLQNTNGSAISAEKAKQEQTWRDQADAIRDQLATAQREIDSLSAAAADPSKSGGERRNASQLIEGRRKGLAGIQKRWNRLAKQAEDHRIPRAWLEPFPTFPQ